MLRPLNLLVLLQIWRRYDDFPATATAAQTMLPSDSCTNRPEWRRRSAPASLAQPLLPKNTLRRNPEQPTDRCISPTTGRPYHTFFSRARLSYTGVLHGYAGASLRGRRTLPPSPTLALVLPPLMRASTRRSPHECALIALPPSQPDGPSAAHRSRRRCPPLDNYPRRGGPLGDSVRRVRALSFPPLLISACPGDHCSMFASYAGLTVFAARTSRAQWS